jgi:hypothetical protein
MPSGGSRARSGPAPDPNSLRSDKRAWQLLPSGGFDGDVPVWPLDESSRAELALWGELWLKPQALMWSKLGMRLQIAAYVRAFLESVEPGAASGLKTAVLRMEGELGLSLPGMHSLGWKFSEDELAQKRSEPVRKKSSSAKSRLAAVSGS